MAIIRPLALDREMGGRGVGPFAADRRLVAVSLTIRRARNEHSSTPFEQTTAHFRNRFSLSHELAYGRCATPVTGAFDARCRRFRNGIRRCAGTAEVPRQADPLRRAVLAGRQHRYARPPH